MMLIVETITSEKKLRKVSEFPWKKFQPIKPVTLAKSNEKQDFTEGSIQVHVAFSSQLLVKMRILRYTIVMDVL